jgi:prephenate dehydratase
MIRVKFLLFLLATHKAYSYGDYLIINMMRHLIRNGFATTRTKYFLDDKYQNVSIESGNQLGSLFNVTNTLKENNINMVYIKSHFSNAWTKQKKYCLDISIEKQ